MFSNDWDDITYPFPNFNGTTVEVWKWISNGIPHSIMLGSKLNHATKCPPPPTYTWCYGTVMSCYWPFVKETAVSPHKQSLSMGTFDTVFVVGLKRLLNKQSNGRWLEPPWRPCRVCWIFQIGHGILYQQSFSIVEYRGAQLSDIPGISFTTTNEVMGTWIFRQNIGEGLSIYI